MESKLCCVLSISVECETCKESWCHDCWNACSHVDPEKEGAWGICPADGKVPGWAKFIFWNSRHILMSTTDLSRMMHRREDNSRM